MIKLGEYNNLCVARDTEVGIFLEDDEEQVVLLPGKFIPEEGLEVGDYIEVFVYKDNEGRDIATTQIPKITVENFEALEVSSIGPFGAFMSMGIDKDLLVPFMEQNQKMEEGKSYVVFMYLDAMTNRLAGSAKLEQFLDNEYPELEEKEEVEVLFWKFSDLGLKVIINEEYEGLIYHNNLFEKITLGDRRKAYIHHIREDGKIDVRLQKKGYAHVEPNAQKIMIALGENEGFLPLTDKSTPELIKQQLSMSKKTFKKAIGSLYKEKTITLEKTGIRLIEE